MKFLLLISCIVLCTINSCTNKSVNCNQNDPVAQYELRDIILISIIDEYVRANLINHPPNYAIILDVRTDSINPTISIYYELNLQSLYDDKPSDYVYLDNNIVFIRSDWEVYHFNRIEQIDSLFKEAFPEQYWFYSKYGEFQPPTTYRCEKWIYSNYTFLEKTYH